MRSLSSTVAVTPSTWRPSRRVVSKISIVVGVVVIVFSFALVVGSVCRKLKEPPGGRLFVHAV